MGSVREAGQGLFCVKINTFQKQRKEAPDMAVFRIEKTRDYTVMSNYHLRDRHRRPRLFGKNLYGKIQYRKIQYR